MTTLSNSDTCTARKASFKPPRTSMSEAICELLRIINDNFNCCARISTLNCRVVVVGAHICVCVVECVDVFARS